MSETRLYGLLAEFKDAEQLLTAAQKAYQAGYRRLDAFSPFPIEGLAEAIGFGRDRLPLIVLAGGILGALAKMPLDMVRGEKAGRNARDGFATEHMEIASYELLKRVAERAGDDETVRVCDEIIAQEKAFADFIASNWDRVTELSLQENGVVAA